jgi:hypothetical protein
MIVLSRHISSLALFFISIPNVEGLMMFCRCAIFIFSFFLLVQPGYGYDVKDLKNIIEKGDAEKTWTSISKIPTDLEENDRKKVIDLLRDALFREWSRCAGDLRQVIASKLSSLNAKEAVPDFLDLIKKKMPIDHECAQCGCCFVGWSVKDELEVAMEPDFFCENGLLAALFDMVTFSYSKELSELAESNERYRPQLLVTLGKIGHPRYAHFISKFTGSEDPQTRQAVAYGLGLIKQPSGVRALGVLFEDNQADIRWTASKSLLEIGGEETVEVLNLKLMQSDKNIQALAARTLAKMDINEGRLKLRELAKDTDSQIRGIAIAYLGQIEDKDSKDTILKGLDDESGLVRIYSIYALGYVGNSNDIPAIKKCLTETKEMNLSMGREQELLDGTVDDAIKQIESVR